MKLYKLTQNENTGYDTYDSAVVAAENEDDAKKNHPSRHYRWSDTNDCWMFQYSDGTEEKYERRYSDWTHIRHIKAEYIGEAKEGTKKGVILASFNAG